MNKKIILGILLLMLSLLWVSCSSEEPFVPEYQNPEDNMVVVEGGTYTMGDWNVPYVLDFDVCEGANIKDVTPTMSLGLFFTNDARATHDVTVNSFAISKYEVTYEQFDRFSYEMNGYLTEDGFEGDDDAYQNYWGHGNRPAINIGFVEACEYCNWLSRKEGRSECYEFLGATMVRWYENANGYRLPTEAEWEFAARERGLQKLYSGINDDAAQDSFWVDTLDSYVHTDRYISLEGTDSLCTDLRDYAWFNLNSGWQSKDDYGDVNGQTHPVGTKLPNALGLHDMSGSVWEWCWDWYSPDYYAYCQTHPEECIDPKGPSEVGECGALPCHTLRGGTWANYPVFLRTTFRFFSAKQVLMTDIDPDYAYHNWRTGFRIVRKLDPEEM